MNKKKVVFYNYLGICGMYAGILSEDTTYSIPAMPGNIGLLCSKLGKLDVWDLSFSETLRP